MPMNTTYLSEGTTHFTSSVTIDGSLVVGGTTTVTSGGTFTGVIASSSAVSGGAAKFSSLTIGALGQPLLAMGGSKTSVAAITVTATKSVETTFADNNVLVGDVVSWGLGTSTSSVSAGLDIDTFVSANSTITIRFSNVSAANAAQPAISLSYSWMRF